MDDDTLDLFRTTHTVLTAVEDELRGQALRETQLRERVTRMDAETAELRDEVHALANRIESVIRLLNSVAARVDEGAIMPDPRLHSVKVPE